MDITNFMTWFINQVINLLSYIFNLLNNIKFMGTSLLKVILTVQILAIIIKILLTISENTGGYIERVDKKIKKIKKNQRKE